jgi:hypothetical protein
MTIGGSAAAATPVYPPMQIAGNSAIQTAFPIPFRMAPPLCQVFDSSDRIHIIKQFSKNSNESAKCSGS